MTTPPSPSPVPVFGGGDDGIENGSCVYGEPLPPVHPEPLHPGDPRARDRSTIPLVSQLKLILLINV